ncbi:MAG: hypothetical protein NZ846_11555, partial [Thermus sp.]|nr:hypothetical protein [Thermus sp.]
KASPPLVNEGTKPLQRALKGAGLWQGFYRVFRPGFPSEALWGRYLARLEREALPLGEAFLTALARTLERAALGAVRFPAPYLDRLLEEARKEASPPPPPPPTEVAFGHGDLLLLPDGRKGHFAGWTARGAKAFVEWDGTAYLVPKELLLGARVVG